jgi:hypothetical protein
MDNFKYKLIRLFLNIIIGMLILACVVNIAVVILDFNGKTEIINKFNNFYRDIFN